MVYVVVVVGIIIYWFLFSSFFIIIKTSYTVQTWCVNKNLQHTLRAAAAVDFEDLFLVGEGGGLCKSLRPRL